MKKLYCSPDISNIQCEERQKKGNIVVRKLAFLIKKLKGSITYQQKYRGKSSHFQIKQSSERFFLTTLSKPPCSYKRINARNNHQH